MLKARLLDATATDVDPRSVLVFDGDCSFCRRWVERWRKLAGEKIEFVPYQQAAARFTSIPAEQFSQRIHLIEPSGEIYGGARAVFRMLDLVGHKRWLYFCYDRVPAAASVAETIYRFVAAHRGGMNRVDLALLGRSTEPVTYYRTRAIFLRLVGLIYLIAFLSLWAQIDGLIGSRGVSPVAPFLDLVRERVPGVERYHLLPTLCWMNASDGFLQLLCGGGAALSLALIIGILPAPILALLWLDYLSLTVAGQQFLNFQWDALLIEAGFIAIFFAPLSFVLSARSNPPPSFAMLLMLRWLLFRVMFLSGVVKLSSGDPTWRNLTAMQFHYFTQPLPTWTSWYIAKLPASIHRIESLFTFVAELWLPLFFWMPRRARWLGFWGTVALQLLIGLTGNFGFFNLLTIVLAVTLLDDSAWRRGTGPLKRTRRKAWSTWTLSIIAIAFFFATLAPFIESFGVDAPAPFSKLNELVAPLRIANGYGLFRVMTTKRPEIIIQGSDDGVTWKTYEFRYKPGDDLARTPRFCTPHMPRLDWQLWFEALRGAPPEAGGSGAPPSGWFGNFLLRLLHNEPAVTKLLAARGNPFADHPPLLVRAMMYDYEFTTADERGRTGAWWKRQLVGEYVPPVSLRSFGEKP